MRIGFLGSHSTGKTSVADEIVRSRLLDDIAFVPSTARKINSYGYPINQQATPVSQFLVTVSRMVDEDTIASGNHKYTVSDRTPLDSLAYTHWQARNVWNMQADDPYLTYSRELVLTHMKKYDHVFFFPVTWGLMADGIRSDSEKYRVEVGGLMKSLADFYGVQYHTVPDVSPMGRAAYIIDVVTGAI